MVLDLSVLAIVFFLILADQAIKFLVVSLMELGESIPVFAGIFHITYIENPVRAVCESALSFYCGRHIGDCGGMSDVSAIDERKGDYSLGRRAAFGRRGRQSD